MTTIEELSRKLEKRNRNLSIADNEIKKINEELRYITEEYRNLTNTLNATNEELYNLESNISDLNNKNELLEKENHKLNEQKHGRSTDKSEEDSKLRSKYEVSKQSIKELQTELSNLKMYPRKHSSSNDEELLKYKSENDKLIRENKAYRDDKGSDDGDRDRDREDKVGIDDLEKRYKRESRDNEEQLKLLTDKIDEYKVLLSSKDSELNLERERNKEIDNCNQKIKNLEEANNNSAKNNKLLLDNNEINRINNRKLQKLNKELSLQLYKYKIKRSLKNSFKKKFHSLKRLSIKQKRKQKRKQKSGGNSLNKNEFNNIMNKLNR